MANNPNGIEHLRQFITEEFAERCPDYEPTCLCCTVWRAFDELAQRCPDLSDEDADMAMHWADRYSAGIDDYPQFDRIAGRAAIEERS